MKFPLINSIFKMILNVLEQAELCLETDPDKELEFCFQVSFKNKYEEIIQIGEYQLKFLLCEIPIKNIRQMIEEVEEFVTSLKNLKE